MDSSSFFLIVDSILTVVVATPTVGGDCAGEEVIFRWESAMGVALVLVAGLLSEVLVRLYRIMNM